MSIAVQAVYQSYCTVTRTYSGEGISPNQNTVVVNQMNTVTTLSATSSPAVSKDACITLALVSGAVTLDLTAITDPTLGTVNLNGLTPQFMKLQNPAANANPITIVKGASSGYTGWGASFDVTIQPGGEVLLSLAGSAVGSGSKTLDLTGTSSQALNIQIVAG